MPGKAPPPYLGAYTVCKRCSSLVDLDNDLSGASMPIKTLGNVMLEQNSMLLLL